MEVVKNKVVIKPDTSEYKAVINANGKRSLCNGDPVATALIGATVEDAAKLLERISGGVHPAQETLDMYKHLNLGQMRMVIGNRIRGLVSKKNKENEGSGDDALSQEAEKLRKAIDARSPAESVATVAV